MFTINEILSITDGELVQGDDTQMIGSVHFDTRKLCSDGLFIALTSGVRDGHTFLKDAADQGAAAALISTTDVIKPQEVKSLGLIRVADTEKAFQQLAAAYRATLDIPVVAITGSNGKTTTKDMMAHVLSHKKKVFKTKGNYNNHLGVPLSLLDISKQDEAAVLELGMNHAGEIDFLAHLAQPHIGVLTNIGDAHIEFFGTKDKIAEAKGELLPHISLKGFALLNLDDSYVCSQAERYQGDKVYYSIEKKADIYATNIAYHEHGTSFHLHIGEKAIAAFIPTFGHYNVANVLPAAYVAYKLGYTLKDITEALLTLTISDMRFQTIKGKNGSILINDAYNASPTSMKASVETFANIYPDRQKVVVLGDIFELGENAEQLHADVGHAIKDNDVKVITVGDLSKHISDVCQGTHVHSKEEALNSLQSYLSPEYALLFKGSRGMKLEAIVDQVKAEETEG
ncbi:UDP-N-acetylmuramoyl-tripeptide--D-alanyl-D-alanine ligase [Caldalkalibacillus salinus]|uniref:UDP-N-acetylmuramoyl-tripeptide--D-alanyl-D- alanine ligase n=1 Tax=Caldalkalibacillus salinus TaxID=2803787 RepID=UPI0019227B94|nr:UDP-N-acetylmuramoyl-tripeptide--D-alanyl-D-alanine ligase [Caldalkalibacillus salinus]